MISKKSNLVVDGREFAISKRTGISRVLEGILLAFTANAKNLLIRLACPPNAEIPGSLLKNSNVKVEEVSAQPRIAEYQINRKITRDCDLFLSPYPKLPIGRSECKFAHIIHDLFFLTHRRKRNLKFFRDLLRVRHALNKADLTWYDSEFSLNQTIKFLGYPGGNPIVRYPGMIFDNAAGFGDAPATLAKYDLVYGYILALGNGRPHKNLEIIIDIADQVDREIVFVGVDTENQKRLYAKPKSKLCKWINEVSDRELTSIMGNAFCLVQPSLHEGFGYPPLEAMANGIPAIISDIPVLVETCGKHALRASPLCKTDWIGAIKQLEDRSVFQYQIKKGYQWVEKFKTEQAWEGYLHDIETLLSNLD
jgi:glycosyltransferase involved in cell wall biosynthesis